MKLAEILSGPETWCQVRYRDGAGRFCLAGALMEVTHDDELLSPLAQREVDRLCHVVGVQQLTEWNDDPARTWEEVAAVVEAYDRDRLLNP